MSSAEPNEPTSPAILERELPLERLRAALANAQSGSGRLVLVGGEAGVGKTALVRCFCEERRGSIRVLWGACDALFTPRPLGPFLDVASAIGGRFAHILEGEARPHDVSVAMMEELTARPTILVLEDLHGADEATLDVLELLGRRIRPSSAFVVATYRNDELAPTHPLRIVLGELATQDAVMRINVERLSREAVTELAMPYDIDPEELYRATDGNPFFATEVLAAAGQEMPQTIRDAVLARAARLSPAARSVLEAVAVVPREVELWLLDALTDGDTDALDECLVSGTLTDVHSGVAFRHELARIAVEKSLSPTRRRQLQRRALAALEASPTGLSISQGSLITPRRPATVALSIATPRPPRSERHGSELTARQPLSLAATDPEVLVYERRNNGSLKLVAVEYVVFTSAVSEQPKLFGIPFDYNDGSRYGLDPFWALHAWIWKPNPSDPAGIFNARNPRVS